MMTKIAGHTFGLYLIKVFYILGYVHFASGNSLEEQMEEMGIDKEMFRYKDLFTLTSSNFSNRVLDSLEPWVVVMHRGTFSAEWKEAAVRSRGIVWFGMVNLDKEGHLIREMNIQDPESITPENDIARVYPFGDRSKKEKKYRDVYKASTALAQAVRSLPFDSITSIKDADDLNQFVMDCLLTSPSRFPSIFIYKPGTSFPPEFLSISIHLKRYFHFGRIKSDIAQELVSLGVDTKMLRAPTLIVLASKIDDGGNMIQRGIRCKYTNDPSDDNGDDDEDTPKVPSYPKILECLYNINSRFRSDLPGNNMAEDEEVLVMEDVLEQEERRFHLSKTVRPAVVAQVGRHSQGTVDVVDNETSGRTKDEL